MSTTSKSQAVRQGKGKYVLRVVAYFILLAIINTIAFKIQNATSSFLPVWVGILLEGLFYLGAALALTWSFCRFWDGSSINRLGLRKQRWIAYVSMGLGMGALLMLLIFVVFWGASWLTVERSDSWQSLTFGASVATWIMISFVEELTFRGYIMQGLARAWGMPIAVGVSSLLFGVVHSLNPNATALGVLTIFVGGVLFACAYLVTRSLWLPIGLHVGWNLVEVHLLGFPGSGHLEPSILHTITHGPEWMTGGMFGPEGGILSLAAELAGIVVLLAGYRIAVRRKMQNNN